MSAAASSSAPGSLRALNLERVYGFSCEMAGAVESLVAECSTVRSSVAGGVDREFPRVVYVAGNTAVVEVLGDANQPQLLLQAHSDRITSLCVSRDRKWICTADAGDEPMSVVWCAESGCPVRTMFSPHGANGANVVAFTDDARILGSVGTSVNSQNESDTTLSQSIILLSWSAPKEKNIFESHFSILDKQFGLQFVANSKIREYPLWAMTIGAHSVCFWSLGADSNDEKQTQATAPIAFTSDPAEPQNTCCRFLSQKSAIVSNSAGDISLWEIRGREMWQQEKKFSRVHSSRITCIRVIEAQQVFITGADDGFIRVFDFTFKLLYFFEKIKCGPIRSVATAFEGGLLVGSQLPSLIIGTTTGVIAHVESTSDAPPSASGCGDSRNIAPTSIIKGPRGVITCIAMHPSEPYIAVCCSSGELSLWNYETYQIEGHTRTASAATHAVFLRGHPTMAVFSDDGCVQLYEVRSDVFNAVGDLLQVAAGSFVVAARSSPDGQFLACADAQHAIAVLQVTNAGQQLVAAGRVRSHTERVVGLWFARSADKDGGSRVLYSVSSDRTHVRHELRDGRLVHTERVARIEQTAVPTAFALDDENDNGAEGDNDGDEASVYLATDQWHLKCYNGDQLVGRETNILPAFVRQRVQELRVFRTADGVAHVLFSSDQRLVGLLRQPYDGDPYAAAGVLAHHGPIAGVAVARDGTHVFTAGGDSDDGSLRVWRVHAAAIDVQRQLGGTRNAAQLAALISPRDPQGFIEEAQRLFYYSQIRAEGESQQSARILREHTPLAQLPSLLRVLGHFPSNHELQSLVAQVSLWLLDRGRDANITFDEWLRVAWNSQNATQPTQSEVQRVMSEIRTRYPGIEPEAFLQSYGEPLTRDELRRLERANILAELTMPETSPPP